jgi:hypothetical protein
MHTRNGRYGAKIDAKATVYLEQVATKNEAV